MKNLRRLMYFCLVIAVLCLAEMVTYCSSQAFASDVPVASVSDIMVIPCLKLQGSKWIIVKGTECGQITKGWLLRNNKALLKLQFYKEIYEPKTKEEKNTFARMEQLWKQQLAACDKQRENQVAIALQYKGMSEQWEKSYLTLKKQKVPPKSWLEHPALWFTLGAVAAVAVVVSSVALYNALRGNLGTTSGPLLSPRSNTPRMLPRTAPSSFHSRQVSPQRLLVVH